MGEISDVVGGGTPKTNDPTNYEGGTIPWITPADLSGYTAKHIAHGARFITQKGLEESSAKMMAAGTVMFTSRAPIGYVAIASNPVCTNQGFKSFVLKGGVLPDYVYWWLKGSKDLAESMASGTTFLELSGAKAKQIPIPVAPLDQQKHIVAEIEKQFSRLDEAVANLKRVKANLKRYKAAVLKAAVEGRLVETEAELARREGRSYETGEQLLQRILETRRSQWKGKGKYKEPAAPDTTDLAELPEGWVWASVEQIADVGTGATPLRSKREYYDDGKIPWVTSGALNEEFVSAADEHITDFAVRATNAKAFPAHTLLVAMYGEGKTRGKVSELLIEAATNQACAAIVMEGLSAKVRDYVKLFFLKNYEDIRRLSSGGVQPNLNLSHIKATVLPLAPLAEQNRNVAEVDRRLSLVRGTEGQVDANLQRAGRMRQALLSSLFSGKRATRIREECA
jgi:type I restriction enzyme S subunit